MSFQLVHFSLILHLEYADVMDKNWIFKNNRLIGFSFNKKNFNFDYN